MASLNGITLKAIKQYDGHDGGAMQASIYMDNKKIGIFEEDDWGGPPYIWFTDSEKEIEFKKRVKLHYEKYLDVDSIALMDMSEDDVAKNGLPYTKHDDSKYVDQEDYFIDKIMLYIEAEKSYKNMKKENPEYKDLIMVFFDSSSSSRPSNKTYTTIGTEAIFEEIKKEAEAQTLMYHILRFKSLDDFIVE